MPFWKKKNWLQSYAQDYSRPQRSYRPWILVVVIIFAFLAWLLIPLVVNGAIIILRIGDVSERVDVIKEAVTDFDLKQVGVHSKEIVTDLKEIKLKLGKLGPLAKIPPLKRLVELSSTYVSASVELLEGYNEILTIFTELQVEGGEEALLLNLAQSGNKKVILELISTNEEKLVQAELKIATAKSELATISVSQLSGLFGKQLIIVNGLLNEVTEKSSAILPLIRHLPEIAGLNEEKTYLLLFMNNMELRPTGGFIGSYGLLKVKDGVIVSLETDDIYNLDKHSIGKLKIDPPWPMMTYFNQKELFLRDANWSPDWPTSAKTIDWFWQAERINAGLPPTEVDAIIALTPDFIANILEITGDIEVDGITFNHKNFALELEMAVEFDYVDRGIPSDQRKDIIGDLSKIMFVKIFDLSFWELTEFMTLLKQNFVNKNIISWFKNPEIQAHVSSRNWAGEVSREEGDYLYVVDANLGALKTDQVMRKSINYSLRIDDQGDLIAKAEITYDHRGEKVTALINNYRTYTRVYVPEKTWFNRVYLKEGDQIVDYAIPSQVNIEDEFGKRSLGLFFTVGIGKTKTLILEYRLPETIKEQYLARVYKLIVQKQPGTIGHPLKINLNFDRTISDYYSTVSAKNKEFRSLFFNTSLETDYQLEVNFK
jgi:hypothetical protein